MQGTVNINHSRLMLGTKVAQNLFQEEAAFATLIANYDGCKRVFPPAAILTLSQSGLLAVLLKRQRYKAIQSAWRHAREAKMHRNFWRTLDSLLHARGGHSAEPLIGTVPRHT